MFSRGIFILITVLAPALLACGPTPGQVNDSAHEPYLSGDYAAALDTYQDAQAGAPESGAPYYNAGNVLYRMEEYEKSLEDYDESLKFARSELRARGFFNRGNASFQQQRYEQAIEAYKEALRMNPDDLDAKHNLELALSQLPPPEQDDQQQEQDDQQQDDQQDEQQDDQDQDQDDQQQEQEQEQEQDDQNQDDQDQDNQQQDDQQQAEQQTGSMTAEQARQILETVGGKAQTLQERRGQVLVSPGPPSDFDW